MKVRSGFVSNSSASSFIVKTRPTEWDRLLYSIDIAKEEQITLPKDKVDLLKQYGFIPTVENNPFRHDFNAQNGGDYSPTKIEDDTLLRYWISCNQDYVMRFLVANNIPFKASVHYGDYLYSYDRDSDCVYILSNFGLSHLDNPADFYLQITDKNKKTYINVDPIERISKEDFLKDYNEKESKQMMGTF